MTTPLYIHHPLDGRGLRSVYVNGLLVPKALFANVRQGFALAHADPMRPRLLRGKPVCRIYRGKVEVVFK